MLADTRTDAARHVSTWPSTVILQVTSRKTVRSAVGWGVVFGLYTATQALAYASSYATPAARRLLVQEFGANTGISALVGPAIQIDTVPGFTAWKCLTVLAITAAVWGILTSTRMMRGEEDAGRWELLLAGRTTRRRSAAEALLAMAMGLVALLVTTGIITIAMGRSSKVGIGAGAALFFALAVVAGACMFTAIGALASQLSSTRRQAAGYASALLGVSYALRMVADSGTDLAWLRWATPLGWIEELQPLTRPNPLALVPIALLTAAAAAYTVYLAGRRDLGASVFPDRSSTAPHLRLLSGSVGLAFRLMRSMLIAWAASIIAYGLLLGSIAKSGGKIMTSTPSMRLVFARLGVTGAEAYLGFALLIMAMALNFVAAGQISATRAEESIGRLEYLLVRPLSRTRWLASRIVMAAGIVVLAGLLAGLSTWLGAAGEHAGVSFSSMVEAGLNIVPPALLLLGIGALVYGALPRLVTFATYGVLVWSLLVELTGGIVNVNHWILDTSAFHQMAAAPSAPIDWTTNAIMTAIGVAGALAGLVAFNLRDLKGE
jgi:ABC-2 type transport system permease protein